MALGAVKVCIYYIAQARPAFTDFIHAHHPRALQQEQRNGPRPMLGQPPSSRTKMRTWTSVNHLLLDIRLSIDPISKSEGGGLHRQR